MPYKDRATQREYQREWVAKRRNAWIIANGPCVRCGSTLDLQVDHKDPSQKVDHRVWSWSIQRQVEELAKCQVLCGNCHKIKTALDVEPEHGTRSRYQNGCTCELCTAANTRYMQHWRSSTMK